MPPKSLALAEQRKAAETELLALADAAEAGSLTDEQTARSAELTAELGDIRKREELVAAGAALRAANPTAEVTTDDAEIRRLVEASAPKSGEITIREQSPYAADSGQSFFIDQIDIGRRDVDNGTREEVRERLMQHYRSAGDEASAAQVRTHSVGTPSEGGVLVAPAYLQNEFIEVLAESNTVSSLVTTIPISEGPLGKTVSVHLPKQLSRAGVGAHTENNALANADGTFDTVQADIKRRGGRATVPNFLLDRSLPGIDQIILRGLAEAAAEDLNDLVMTNNVSNAKGFLAETSLGDSPFTATTPTLDGFKSAMFGSIEDVYTGIKSTVGVGILMTVRRWFWVLNLVDQSTNGYLRVNDKVAFDANGVPTGGTGPVGWLAGVPIYLDHSIPVNLGAGTNQDSAITSRFSESWLLRSNPKFAVSEHAGFDNDQTKMRVTYDAGFSCARRKEATSIVGGTGMAM